MSGSGRPTSVTRRELRARGVRASLRRYGDATIEDLYFRRELRNWTHLALQLAVADLIVAGELDVSPDGRMSVRDDGQSA